MIMFSEPLMLNLSESVTLITLSAQLESTIGLSGALVKCHAGYTDTHTHKSDSFYTLMPLAVCQVDDLKAKLAAQEVELKQKNEDADKLIQVVGVETEKVTREKAVADEEEQKVATIAVEVSRKQRDCEEDLAKAEPALVAAQEALNTLNKVT